MKYQFHGKAVLTLLLNGTEAWTLQRKLYSLCYSMEQKRGLYSESCTHFAAQWNRSVDSTSKAVLTLLLSGTEAWTLHRKLYSLCCSMEQKRGLYIESCTHFAAQWNRSVDSTSKAVLTLLLSRTEAWTLHRKLNSLCYSVEQKRGLYTESCTHFAAQWNRSVDSTSKAVLTLLLSGTEAWTLHRKLYSLCCSMEHKRGLYSESCTHFAAQWNRSVDSTAKAVLTLLLNGTEAWTLHRKLYSLCYSVEQKRGLYIESCTHFAAQWNRSVDSTSKAVLTLLLSGTEAWTLQRKLYSLCYSMEQKRGLYIESCTHFATQWNRSVDSTAKAVLTLLLNGTEAWTLQRKLYSLCYSMEQKRGLYIESCTHFATQWNRSVDSTAKAVLTLLLNGTEAWTLQRKLYSLCYSMEQKRGLYIESCTHFATQWNRSVDSTAKAVLTLLLNGTEAWTLQRKLYSLCYSMEQKRGLYIESCTHFAAQWNRSVDSTSKAVLTLLLNGTEAWTLQRKLYSLCCSVEQKRGLYIESCTHFATQWNRSVDSTAKAVLTLLLNGTEAWTLQRKLYSLCYSMEHKRGLYIESCTHFAAQWNRSVDSTSKAVLTLLLSGTEAWTLHRKLYSRCCSVEQKRGLYIESFTHFAAQWNRSVDSTAKAS